MSQVTLTTLSKARKNGDKIAMLTAYDAAFATLCDKAGVDAILVGDSLGMVVQGHSSTVPVTLDNMAYHVEMVARGCSRPLIIADLPFMQACADSEIFSAARRLMQAGAHMVKLEGCDGLEAPIRVLAKNGVPVCGHLGLTPQSVHVLGGYRVQGRGDSGEAIVDQARRLAEAGCQMLVLECVPRQLAQRIAAALPIPVIGIGAGPDTHGQVLVMQDILGITPGKPPKFARDFISGHTDGIVGAIERYVQSVKQGQFPEAKHWFED